MPRGCFWKNAFPPSVPAWTGRRKKGGAEATETITGVAPAGVGQDGGAVSGGATRLRLGSPGGPFAGQPGRSAGGADQEAFAPDAGAYACGSPDGPGAWAAGTGLG